MKRLVVICMIGIMLTAIGCSTTTITINRKTSILSDTLNFPLDSIVYVQAEQWSGSGVVISSRCVLTAGHVVEGLDTIRIRINDHKKIFIGSTHLIKFDGVDLGVILFDEDLPVKPVPLGTSYTARIGETVYIIGYPFGTNVDIVSKGIVAGVEVWEGGFFGNINMLVVDAASHPGNSGGAVLNDKGELIGILVGGYRGHDNYSICVPIDVYKARALMEFLKDIL